MSDATTATADTTTLLGGDTTAGADTSTASTTQTTDANTAPGDKDGKPAADAKPAADGKPADAKPADDKPAGAPEKYAEFKLPEGAQMDEARMGKFTTWAKTNNLSQENAQAALDLHTEMMQTQVANLQTSIQAQIEKWSNDSRADKEFGGDKFDENLAGAKRALDQFGTPELKTLLKQTGLGNHPEILRAFHRVGQAISQDGFAPGRNKGATTDARGFYSASNMNP